jgi:hypothetical protein
MYKTAFKRQATASTMPEGHISHICIFREGISPGMLAYERHAEKIKGGKAKGQARKQASLSLRKFSFE